MLRRLSVGLIVIASSAVAQVPGEEQVHAVTFSNGMQVIVWPDRDIPNVAMYNWERVGSRNEVPGITGLAHFFEHMMFNGTSTRAPGEFDRILEANGASNNAYTSNDVTVYQNWLPSVSLETIFELEADRLRNLSFDPQVIESERGVVYSERRLSVDDSQFGRLAEQVQATAYVAHPYSNPTIGWPSDIESWTVDDLKTFFKRYYAPNNCTVILVGDLDPKQTIALARKYFESIPSQPPPEPIRTKEPEQRGERRVDVVAEAQTPLLQLAYHGVAGSDPRLPALELLTRILTDGDASRLHRALVEEQKIAIAADSQIEAGFDPSLVWFFLALPAGADTRAAEAAFDAEIERVIATGVTQDELDRARNQALADFWRSLTTINGKAQALGTYEVLRGGYAGLFEAPQAYEAVTREQLQKVATELLRRTNRTVGVLSATQITRVEGEE